MAFNNMDLYEARKLKDYKIASTEDIKEIYGIDNDQIQGYAALSNENKELFQKFIVNFYNGIGLDSRMIFRPIQVNYVIQNEYSRFSYKSDDGEDVYELICTEFMKLNDIGKYVAFKKHIFEKDVNITKYRKFTKSFLRIDYKWGTRKEWLHIIAPHKWY